MEFAKREMQKYGWKEGKGLGRHETGMTKAITPKLKFDTAGIGHDYSEEFTYNWWEVAYDSALKNVAVESNENGVSVQVCDKDLEVTNKKITSKKKKKKSELIHGRFFKTSTLLADGSINESPGITEETDVIQAHTISLTDEDLFRICGGRTAHKGAPRRDRDSIFPARTRYKIAGHHTSWVDSHRAAEDIVIGCCLELSKIK